MSPSVSSCRFLPVKKSRLTTGVTLSLGYRKLAGRHCSRVLGQIDKSIVCSASLPYARISGGSVIPVVVGSNPIGHPKIQKGSSS